MTTNNDAPAPLTQLSPNRIRLGLPPVEREGVESLLVLDTYYPGWKAYVDSEPAELLVANDVFKAVVLTAGTHRVKFLFLPWRTYAGMAVSGLTALVVVGLLFWIRSRTVSG